VVDKLVAEAGLAVPAVKGIGIGAPGPLDTKKGIIAEPPNLRDWWGFPIVDSLKRYYSVPITFENDATAAALAERWVGAGRETDHFVYMTVSTGIGAGIFSHGRLITGATGNAGDIGHIVIDASVGTCPCGQKGCLEYIASGTAIARMASELVGHEVSSKEAFELAFSGENAAVKELVDRVFRYIGVGCVTMINTLDPELVIIGGGVSQVGAPLFDAVTDYIQKHALNPSGRRTRVVPAGLSQDAGLIGAAALIHIDYKGV
jgi:glucokinase